MTNKDADTALKVRSQRIFGWSFIVVGLVMFLNWLFSVGIDATMTTGLVGLLLLLQGLRMDESARFSERLRKLEESVERLRHS